MAALNSRAEILLKTLVERYIADGQPVGSRTLATQAGLDISPATIRNIMSNLEAMGLVRSPHTSSGRVPTDLGYRVFVDTLLKVKDLQPEIVRMLKGELEEDRNSGTLIESVSHVLSELTHMTGIVMIPRREEQSTFRHVDFVSLSARRLLVILVTDEGKVHNRVINVDKDYSPAELVQASNYFNETFSGMPYESVKRVLLDEMRETTEDMHRIMRLAVEAANKMFTDERPQGENFVVSGEANLMDLPDLADMRLLRRLFEAFNTKRDLLVLLDKSMCSQGVKIFIGSESGYEALEQCSLVTAPYTADGRVVGTLGVVGPTRMPYDRVISIVDVTARLLSGALGSARR